MVEEKFPCLFSPKAVPMLYSFCKLLFNVIQSLKNLLASLPIASSLPKSEKLVYGHGFASYSRFTDF